MMTLPGLDNLPLSGAGCCCLMLLLLLLGLLSYRLYLVSCPLGAAAAAGHAPPGLFPWPIIGNLPTLGERPHVALMTLAQRYGDVFSIKLGSWPAVALNGYEAVHEALQDKDLLNRPPFPVFKSLCRGVNLAVGPDVDAWRALRKVSAHSLRSLEHFHGDGLAETILAETDALVDGLLLRGWQPERSREAIDTTVLSILAMVSYGEGVRSGDQCLSDMQSSLTEFNRAATAGNILQAIPWLTPFLPGIARRLGGALTRFENSCSKLVDAQDSLKDEEKRNFCSYAAAKLQSHKNLGFEEKPVWFDYSLKAIMPTLIGGGSDGPGACILWGLFFCTTQHDFQEKIQREIDEVVGRGTPHNRHRNDMPYTEAFILELIRYGTPLPMGFPRYTLKDITFRQFLIPKGTVVMTNFWSANRDARIWDDPDTFNPDRFVTSEGAVDRAKEAKIMSFGSGPRICFGMNLAKLELFLMLTRTLQRCTLEKVPGHKYTLDYNVGLSIRPVPYPVIIKPRGHLQTHRQCGE